MTLGQLVILQEAAARQNAPSDEQEPQNARFADPASLYAFKAMKVG